jgi:hypothetical protein
MPPPRFVRPTNDSFGLAALVPTSDRWRGLEARPEAAFTGQRGEGVYSGTRPLPGSGEVFLRYGAAINGNGLW